MRCLLPRKRKKSRQHRLVKDVLGVLFWVLLPAILVAQEIPRYTISGTVVDKETGEPLHYVNVFLANTTLGTATDEQGLFEIPNIRTGAYTLVVSMIGYGVQHLYITVDSSSPKYYPFGLPQQPVEAPLITVTGKRDRDHARLVKKIKPFLLGISNNASRCEIENPEVLTITATENDKKIDVSADYPLNIVNKALGYRMALYIEQFTILDEQKVDYLLHPRFYSLTPKSERQKSRWDKKRKETYNGSISHFFHALIHDHLEEEGFLLFKQEGNPTFLRAIDREALSSDSLVSKDNSRDAFYLDLPRWISIIYRDESEFLEYFHYMKSARTGSQTPEFQMSMLEVLVNPLTVNESGHLYGPRLVVKYGHWAFDLIGETLPLDYQPDQSSDPGPGVDSTPSQMIKAAIAMAENNEELEDMTTQFYEGLEQLGNDPYADTLCYGLKDILAVKEIRGYEESPDKGRFLLTIFQSLDPSPATPENERIPVHYQRLKYARTWFSSPQSRGYDDRGEIWVRYGEPDLRERMPSNSSLYANECWVYWISDGIWFDFACSSGAHYELIWAYMPVDVTPLPGRQIPGNLPHEFWEKRRHLHIVFEVLASGFADGQAYRDIVPKTFERQARLPRSVDNLERLSKPLHLTVSSARFYRSGQTRLELYYALPYNELQLENGGDSLVVPLRTSWALRDASGTVVSYNDSWKDVPQSADSGHCIDQTVIMASGFPYTAALELQHPLGQATAEQVIEFEGFNAAEEDLLLSDIQLASDIRPAPANGQPEQYIKNNLLIQPWPFDRIDKRKPIFIYFEIYNLFVSANGYTDAEVSYEVRYAKKGLERVNIFSRAPSYGIGTTFDLQVKHQKEPVYFSLDLSAVESHEYTIIVTVKDRPAGRTFRREKGVYVE